MDGLCHSTVALGGFKVDHYFLRALHLTVFFILSELSSLTKCVSRFFKLKRIFSSLKISPTPNKIQLIYFGCVWACMLLQRFFATNRWFDKVFKHMVASWLAHNNSEKGRKFQHAKVLFVYIAGKILFQGKRGISTNRQKSKWFRYKWWMKSEWQCRLKLHRHLFCESTSL